MRKQILNAAGQPVILNESELTIAQAIENKLKTDPQYHAMLKTNALGYEIDITSLTTIIKKVSEQKFFEIAPADYLPVKVGEGAWSAHLTKYREFSLGEDFEKGNINTGSPNGRLEAADAAIDSVPLKVINWAKSVGWSLFDIQLASRSGNWDLVAAKERSRKKNWDLGIQKIAFLGSKSNLAVQGLLTLSGVNSDLTTITEPISGMTDVELAAFAKAVLESYRSNSARTAWPTHFTIPESDYNGLGSPSSATFPIKTKLAYLEEVFQLITRNKQFKIQPLAYGDKVYSGLSVQRYVLLNYDEDSIQMDIPVDYTSTLANSVDNFTFNNVGYGQYTGAVAYRPLEVLYFDY